MLCKPTTGTTSVKATGAAGEIARITALSPKLMCRNKLNKR